ncbi:Uncharacterised protein [Mycobacteroides abscessus subsp. abscessus]|nr:Uncharacterised protein [Mycobacteroides abscessus subsp. abscessus]
MVKLSRRIAASCVAHRTAAFDSSEPSIATTTPDFSVVQGMSNAPSAPPRTTLWNGTYVTMGSAVPARTPLVPCPDHSNADFIPHYPRTLDPAPLRVLLPEYSLHDNMSGSK